jgi:hypothetical protein
MGGLFRLLLLVGFLVKFWWLILLVIAVVAAGCRLWIVVARHDAERSRQNREHAAFVARADGQHAQIMAGDDRGIYGRDTPKPGLSELLFRH